VIDWTGALSLLGPLSIGSALIVLGWLSRRLGEVTRDTSYYRGFYLAAGLVSVGVVARLANLGYGAEAAARLHRNLLWVLLYHGVPALGVTLGVIIAWRYWSWLLAERD
jgi:hypothetical protein